MKVLVILLVLFTVSFLSVNLAHGIWLPQSPEELLEESQVIVVGNITAVNELELEQPFSSEFSLLILDEYTITVEEFVKNPQGTDTITVRQPTISTPGRLVPHGGFEIGDRVLLYIESFDGTNTYSKESFLIPKQCDTSSVIHEPRIIGSDFTMIQNGVEKKDNFTANTPIQFIAKSDTGTLSGDSPSIKYDAFISKQVGKIYKERVFHQTVTADAKPCEWLSVAEWEFTPDAGNYLLNGFVHKEKSGYSISNTFFSVLPESPLKQIQSGISLDEIQCKQNLVLIQKYDGTPACVTESTKTKLIERGWTKDVDEQQSIPVIGHIKDFYHDVRKVESGKTFQIPLEYYPDGIPENLRFGVIGAEIPDARHEFIFNGIEKLPEGIEAEIDNTAMPPNLIITTKQGLSGEQIIGLIIVNDTNGTKELHQYQIRIEN